MGLVLSLSIVGAIVIALLVYFGLKAAVWKQFETETAGAGKSSSSGRKQTLPGANAVRDQKASKEGERVEVLATSGGPSSGADARDNTRIAVAPPATASSKAGPESPVKKEMWADSHYCWIVICKNGGFHRHTNLLFGHRIPLGETDAVSPRPALAGSFKVQCDECGKEYSYEADDVLRFELELPETFTPHRLFRD
jgi:hypothetical protein